MGHDLIDDPEGRIRSESAERDFQIALRQARQARKGFDSRPPPAVSTGDMAMELAGLAADLDEQDRLVREALDDPGDDQDGR